MLRCGRANDRLGAGMVQDQVVRSWVPVHPSMSGAMAVLNPVRLVKIRVRRTRRDQDRLLPSHPFSSAPTTIGFSSSSCPIIDDMNKRFRHQMTPLSDAALQCSQQPGRESTGVCSLQPLHQGLGCRIGIVLGATEGSPARHPRTDLSEFAKFVKMPHIDGSDALLPLAKARELREELVEALPLRAVTQVARASAASAACPSRI